MVEGRFEPIRETALRSKSEKQDEERRRKNGADPWPVFSYDASTYIDAFREAFPHIDSLPDRFARRKERGERIIVVDVLGIADAHSIGADHTFGFTLTQGGEQTSTATLTVVAGDVFKANDIKNFLNILDSQKEKISCVFFKPVGALLEYPKSDYTYEKLYTLLRELYSRLAAEGEIYISAAGFAAETRALVHTLNLTSGVNYCQSGDKRGDGIGAAYAYIVKTAQAPQTLPRPEEIKEHFAKLNAA